MGHDGTAVMEVFEPRRGKVLGKGWVLQDELPPAEMDRRMAGADEVCDQLLALLPPL